MPDSSLSTSRSRITFAQAVAIIAGLIVGLLLVWAWRDVLLLVFASVLIAVGLHGIADPIARRTPLSAGVALLLAGVLVIAVLAGVVWLFGAQIAGQFEAMFGQLPEAWSRLRGDLQQHVAGRALVAEIERWISTSADNPMGAAFARVGGYTMSIAGGLTTALLVVFAAAFIASAPKIYVRGLLKLAPLSVRPRMDGALQASGRALKKWLLGTLASMLAISAMLAIALWLLGVPGFLALALIAGLAQFVPVVGPLLAAIPGVLLALTIGPETAAWTALAYFVASQLEANLLYPLIQQRAVSLPPALTLFAIIAMGVLFGPLGVMLAAPLTVVASIFIVTLYVNGVLNENEPIPGA